MTFIHNFCTPPKLIQSEHPLTGARGYLDAEGNWFQSTTSWIDERWDKSHIAKWKAKIGEAEADRIRDRAADRGTILHNTTELYLRNQPFDLKQMHYLNRSLFVKVKPLVDRINNIRLIETPIMSKRLGIAGKPDCIADFDGTLSVIDFKTSIKPKRKKWIVNYFLQTACYANMYFELTGEMPRKSVLIIGVEESTVPQLQVESMDLCVRMLDQFATDPVKFQKKLA